MIGFIIDNFRITAPNGSRKFPEKVEKVLFIVSPTETFDLSNMYFTVTPFYSPMHQKHSHSTTRNRTRIRKLYLKLEDFLCLTILPRTLLSVFQ